MQLTQLFASVLALAAFTAALPAAEAAPEAAPQVAKLLPRQYDCPGCWVDPLSFTFSRSPNTIISY